MIDSFAAYCRDEGIRLNGAERVYVLAWMEDQIEERIAPERHRANVAEEALKVACQGTPLFDLIDAVRRLMGENQRLRRRWTTVRLPASEEDISAAEFVRRTPRCVKWKCKWCNSDGHINTLPPPSDKHWTLRHGIHCKHREEHSD